MTIQLDVCRKTQGVAESGNSCLTTPGTCESCPNWGKHLLFTLEPVGKKARKTKIWSVRSGLFGTSELGWVRYYPQWRRYVFYPDDLALFDAGCLREIAEFLDNHKEDRL
jgi:hypothetical protein